MSVGRRAASAGQRPGHAPQVLIGVARIADRAAVLGGLRPHELATQQRPGSRPGCCERAQSPSFPPRRHPSWLDVLTPPRPRPGTPASCWLWPSAPSTPSSASSASSSRASTTSPPRPTRPCSALRSTPSTTSSTWPSGWPDWRSGDGWTPPGPTAGCWPPATAWRSCTGCSRPATATSTSCPSTAPTTACTWSAPSPGWPSPSGRRKEPPAAVVSPTGAPDPRHKAGSPRSSHGASTSHRLWWTYFDLAGAAATRTLVERAGHRSTLLHDVYAHGHWPLTLGLAAAGVGRFGRRDPGRGPADPHLRYSLAAVRRGGALPGRLDGDPERGGGIAGQRPALAWDRGPARLGRWPRWRPFPGHGAGWCDGRPGGRGRGGPGQATPGHAHHRSPRGRTVSCGPVGAELDTVHR